MGKGQRRHSSHGFIQWRHRRRHFRWQLEGRPFPDSITESCWGVVLISGLLPMIMLKTHSRPFHWKSSSDFKFSRSHPAWDPTWICKTVVVPKLHYRMSLFRDQGQGTLTMPCGMSHGVFLRQGWWLSMDSRKLSWESIDALEPVVDDSGVISGTRPLTPLTTFCFDCGRLFAQHVTMRTMRPRHAVPGSSSAVTCLLREKVMQAFG